MLMCLCVFCVKMDALNAEGYFCPVNNSASV